MLNSKSDFANLDEITIERPYSCELTQIIQEEENQQFLSAIIKDQKSRQMLAFFYKDLYRILKITKVKGKLPLKLTIIKGIFKDLGKNKYLEVHHAIIDPLTFVNSSSIGGHEFCEMETYLNNYIYVYSEPNIEMLWGNLIHDYLAGIYSRSNIYGFQNKNEQIGNEIKSSFIRAAYNNWQSLVVLGREIEEFQSEFENNFLLNEIDFLWNQLTQYRKLYPNFEFICEKSIYSLNLGIQGRIDRLVQDIPPSEISIYETKTGKSAHSSEIIAFYQAMAYAAILKENYNVNIRDIFIEYPRFSVKDRLIRKEFLELEFLKVLKKRNEIWAITTGNQPDIGPYRSCRQCSSKSACEFYCYRKNQTKFCINHPQKCAYFKFFEADAFHRNLFKQIDAYLTWFFNILDEESSQNQTIIKNLHLPAADREKTGNCIADLIISFEPNSSINDNLVSIIELKKKDNTEFRQNRMRKGDFIILTPQNISPLKSDKLYGQIESKSAKLVSIRLAKPIEIEKNFNHEIIFRLDLTSSNYMATLQKRILDMLVRYSISPKYSNIKTLLDVLLYRNSTDIHEKQKDIKNTASKITLDKAQSVALDIALRTPDLCLIHGPPGTGKTTLIVEIIKQTLTKTQNQDGSVKKKAKINKNALDRYFDKGLNFLPPTRPVLVSAFTNKAVDTILEKLIAAYPEIKAVRIGNISAIENQEILNRTIESICITQIKLENGEVFESVDPLQARMILDNADVIAATTTSAGSLLLNNYHFETVILDEGAQILDPSAIISLIKGDRFIIVGDHLQLPPIMGISNPKIEEKHKESLLEIGIDPDRATLKSIFERLVDYYQKSSKYAFLFYQYRMNRVISDFVSKKFYSNQLNPGTINGKNIGDQKLSDFFKKNNIPPLGQSENQWSSFFSDEHPMIFLDTLEYDPKDSTQNELSQDLESKFNETEAKLTASILSTYIKHILQYSPNTQEILAQLNQLGIITAYRAQNQRIYERLEKEMESDATYKDLIHRRGFSSIDISKSIEIDTVDRFQGQEKEIILYNFVDSNLEHELSSLHLELRRLNVAISRAKKKIIFIGHSETLCKLNGNNEYNVIAAKALNRDLIDYCKDHNSYIKLPKK